MMTLRCILTGFLLALATGESSAQWIKSTGIPSWLECMNVLPRLSGNAYLLAGTPGNGLYISKDTGATWIPLSATLGGPSQACAIADIHVEPRKDSVAILYAIALIEGIFRSSDLGTTWEERDNGLPLNPWGLKAWYDLIQDDTTLLVGTGANGVYRSTDGGGTWAFSGLPGGEVRKLFRYTNQGGEKFLFAYEYNQSVFRSTDHAVTWQSANAGLPHSTWVADFTSIPNGNGGVDLFAATLAGVYRSSDNGTSWNNASTGFTHPNPSVTALLAYKEPGGAYALLAGTYSDGVFLSNDSGKTWRAFNGGLEYSKVDALIENGGYLFTSTGNSIWRRSASSVTEVGGSTVEPPGTFSLLQNYPNPFNPSTTIRYGLPHRSHVTLTVFNVLGQQVAMLVSGEEDAGYHEVRFDGANLASGVYFYRIETMDFVQTRRLLLVR